MKYMGSKRAMLSNGLGELIKAEAVRSNRVVDLFCGGSSVAWFAAEHTNRPVLACDLQSYAVTLAKAVVARTEPLNAESLLEKWVDVAKKKVSSTAVWKIAYALDSRHPNAGTWAKRARELCASMTTESDAICRAYGGYYFSPSQALVLDSLISTLPKLEPDRSACLAAVIMAASQCSASPGHTAQPFGTTRSAGPYLREAWLKNPLNYVKAALRTISQKCAQRKGNAIVGDALEVVGSLGPGDLVFIDPPYSGVHYSRFYHVLETIARGKCGVVSGTGRYPAPSERPASAFSRKSESVSAVERLLEGLSESGVRVIFTFPMGKSSNGLSGKLIEECASKFFKIDRKSVKSRFSTLGGNNSNRDARLDSRELILLLKP